MWVVLSTFVMDLAIIPNSCEFVKVDPTTKTTTIGLVGGILFSLGTVVRIYMDVAPLYASPKYLSLFSIFFVLGGALILS